MKKNGNKYTAKLQSVERQYRAQLRQVALQERILAQSRSIQQVLVDLILHAEHAQRVRQQLDAAVVGLEQQANPQPSHTLLSSSSGGSSSASSSSGSSGSSYCMRIMDSLTPQLVSSMMSWTRDDFITRYSNCDQQMLAALEVLQRPASFAAADAGDAMDQAAMQQLDQALDELARLHTVVFMYTDEVGVAALSTCASNLRTRQFETADASFWGGVVEAVQLEQWQADQVAAAFDRFVRQHESTRVVCRSFTQQCAQSRLQLLADVAEQYASDSGQETHVSAGPHAAVLAAVTRSAAGRRGAAAAAAAADDDGDAEVDGDLATMPAQLNLQLQRYLLRGMSASWMLCIVMFNTLTKMQLVRLAVASYPWVIQISAVAEAVVRLHSKPNRRQPAAGSDGQHDEKWQQQVAEHHQQRLGVLQQQEERWWQQHKQQQLQELDHERRP